MSEKILFNCTHGQDDAERATLPFVAANVAATAGQEAVYPLFTGDLIELMRRLIPREQQAAVATAVVVRAERAQPAGG